MFKKTNFNMQEGAENEPSKPRLPTKVVVEGVPEQLQDAVKEILTPEVSKFLNAAQQNHSLSTSPTYGVRKTTEMGEFTYKADRSGAVSTDTLVVKPSKQVFQAAQHIAIDSPMPQLPSVVVPHVDVPDVPVAEGDEYTPEVPHVEVPDVPEIEMPEPPYIPELDVEEISQTGLLTPIYVIDVILEPTWGSSIPGFDADVTMNVDLTIFPPNPKWEKYDIYNTPLTITEDNAQWYQEYGFDPERGIGTTPGFMHIFGFATYENTPYSRSKNSPLSDNWDHNWIMKDDSQNFQLEYSATPPELIPLGSVTFNQAGNHIHRFLVNITESQYAVFCNLPARREAAQSMTTTASSSGITYREIAEADRAQVFNVFYVSGLNTGFNPYFAQFLNFTGPSAELYGNVTIHETTKDLPIGNYIGVNADIGIPPSSPHDDFGYESWRGDKSGLAGRCYVQNLQRLRYVINHIGYQTLTGRVLFMPKTSSVLGFTYLTNMYHNGQATFVEPGDIWEWEWARATTAVLVPSQAPSDAVGLMMEQAKMDQDMAIVGKVTKDVGMA